jgi:nucleotide-binding universal stress UspA family protein
MAGQTMRIVVGFDGTEGALRALAAATRLTGYGSTITVVNVGDGFDRNGTATLDDARRRLLERLVAANYVRRSGDPADELVCTARELDADLIVLGRRRPFEGSRPGVGSVSANVVQHAPCDVLVVR